MIKFKKDVEGAWGVVGPVDQIAAGETVTVTKRSGETSTVTVITVADEPNTDGTIFGWVASTPRPRAATTPRRSSPRRGSSARRGSTTRSRHACVTGGNCSSSTGRDCGGHNCDAN